MPLLVEIPFFHLIGANLPRQHLANECEIGIEIVWMRQSLEGGCHQFLLGVADQPTEGRVDLEPSSIGSDQGHADRRISKCGTESLLTFSEGLKEGVLPFEFDLDDIDEGRCHHESDECGGHGIVPLDLSTDEPAQEEAQEE